MNPTSSSRQQLRALPASFGPVHQSDNLPAYVNFDKWLVWASLSHCAKEWSKNGHVTQSWPMGLLRVGGF